VDDLLVVVALLREELPQADNHDAVGMGERFRWNQSNLEMTNKYKKGKFFV
jgi:hypothetical protein